MSKQNEAIQQLTSQRQQIVRIWKELNQVEDSVDVYTSRKIGKAMLDLKTAARHLQDAISESNVDANGAKSYSKEQQREFAS
jgi:ABC-type transporter Mla subunit MlaD